MDRYLSHPWQVCLEEAWDAFREGSVPVGAALLDAPGTVLLRGRNRILERSAPPPFLAHSRVAHAEINVLAQIPPDEYQEMHTRTLYTSVEPCPMCFGAAVMSGLRSIRYGARDAWAGAADMARANAYVSSKGLALEGPEPTVERISIALLTAHVLRAGGPRGPEVVAAMRRTDAAAAALGEAWHNEGRLARFARERRPLRAVAHEILDAL